MKGITTVLTGPGSLDQREFALSDPAPGGILLQMIRANVCGSEVHILKGHHPVIQPGCALGHEGVGRVERLGSGVSTDFAGQPLAEGDRVAATYFDTCRRCAACDRGQPNLCHNAYSSWSTPTDRPPHFTGTFGTHWSLHATQHVYRVPDNVSSKAAAAANCALSQMVAAVTAGEVRRGDRVLLLGAGGLGLCGSALAAEAGAEVYIADMVPSRLDKAKTFGAHHAIDLSDAGGATERVDLLRELTDGGADVVVDLTGVPAAFTEALSSARSGGRFVSVGNVNPHQYTQFDPGLYTRSGVTMRAAIRYPAPFLSEALRFLSTSPHYPWEDLVDADFAFDGVLNAINAAEAKSVTRAGIVIAE
ncbi:zinc-binding dehydrogenase [Rhodococcus opacus]|uniref:zinc-binding dehydrogenase n=1 Tax=Rhodococcus opacus TaxID=37919 RepID=UPI00155ABF19|nr:zinc-binding dehydrogenase [Rhodococcus opacus]